MSNGHWRKSRHMNLTNRGLETHIAMEYLPATKSYRVVRIERMIGGMPSQTFDRIYDGEEATAKFKELCVEAVELDYEHPNTTPVKVYDITDAELDSE